jgi:hypothetical protein
MQLIIRLQFELSIICFNKSIKGNGSNENGLRSFLFVLKRGWHGLFDIKIIHLEIGSGFYGVMNALLNMVKGVKQYGSGIR